MCGELLTSPESAIRHTHAPKQRKFDPFGERMSVGRFRAQFLSIHRTKSMASPNIRQIQCPATPPKVPTARVPSRIPSDAVTLQKLSVFIFSLRFASAFDARHSNLTRRQCREASLQWFDSVRIVHIDYPSEITANCG